MAVAIQVEEVYRRSEQGVLRPFLCRASDGEVYFVKGRGAGYRDLISEYLCARLGTLLGLPIPAFSVLEVPARLIATSLLQDIQELGEGSAFGSMLVPSVQELSNSTLHRVPKEIQSRVLLFDWWIQNEDRHFTELGGNPNLLWDMAEQKLVVFDHNAAFDDDFKVVQFCASHAFCQSLAALADPEFQRVEQARMEEAMRHFDTIVAEMPERWLLHSGKAGGAFEVDALRKTLYRYRSPEFWTAQP